MSDGACDLTGTWHGVFNYPHSLPPNEFVARLIDHDGALTGETTEACDDPDGPGGILVAVFTGRHGERGVALEKRYDDLSRADYVVHYVGRIDDDGHEISGHWSVPGIWSGSFVMVRARGIAISRERHVSQVVS